MKIPLFPLEVVLFPEAALPLHIFEDRYKEMVGVCLAEKIGFGVVCAQREGLAVVGCTAEIVRILDIPMDGWTSFARERIVSRLRTWTTPAVFCKRRLISSGTKVCPLREPCASSAPRCISKCWS
jgi:hypothetical protein